MRATKNIGFLLLLGVIFYLSGCAPTGEWTKHDSLYKSFDHAKFSIYGYKDMTRYYVYESQARGWWGDPVLIDKKKVKDLKWK